jgi:hypothetical protein
VHFDSITSRPHRYSVFHVNLHALVETPLGESLAQNATICTHP